MQLLQKAVKISNLTFHVWELEGHSAIRFFFEKIALAVEQRINSQHASLDRNIGESMPITFGVKGC